MMLADLPPSSRVTGRRSEPHCAAMMRPASVEPVKATFATSGCPTSALPVSRPPVTTLITPAGMPAATAASTSTRRSSGVSAAGLMTVVHPAMSAGASLTMTSPSGKFHGAMRAQTPTAWRTTSV
jgi:hypothetical protein